MKHRNQRELERRRMRKLLIIPILFLFSCQKQTDEPTPTPLPTQPPIVKLFELKRVSTHFISVNYVPVPSPLNYSANVYVGDTIRVRIKGNNSAHGNYYIELNGQHRWLFSQTVPSNDSIVTYYIID